MCDPCWVVRLKVQAALFDCLLDNALWPDWLEAGCSSGLVPSPGVVEIFAGLRISLHRTDSSTFGSSMTTLDALLAARTGAAKAARTSSGRAPHCHACLGVAWLDEPMGGHESGVDTLNKITSSPNRRDLDVAGKGTVYHRPTVSSRVGPVHLRCLSLQATTGTTSSGSNNSTSSFDTRDYGQIKEAGCCTSFRPGQPTTPPNTLT